MSQMIFVTLRSTVHRALAAACLLITLAPATALAQSKAECVAANEKAQQLEQSEKLIAARERLVACVAETCPDMIRNDCVERLKNVENEIPSVVFEAKDGDGRDLIDVHVTMDGSAFTERLDGTPLQVDPGPHQFTFETKGVAPLSQPFVIRQSEKNRRELVVLGAPTAAVVAHSSAPKTTTEQAPPALAPHTWAGQRTAAVVTASVGVAAVGVGTVFGLLSRSKHQEANDVCPADCADGHGVDLWNTARSDGNWSTAAFVVGGAALVAGTVLWLTSKPTAAEEPGATALGIGPTGLLLRSVW